jgi:hypothetical protein
MILVMAENTHLCKCSPECKAVVHSKGRKYAKGHNPAFWNRDRVSEEAKTMTAVEYAAYLVKLKEERGPYAAGKKFTKCPVCGYQDGVRGMRRHRQETGHKKK